MKRDMDIIREVLCKISEAETKVSWKELTKGKPQIEVENILYNINLCNDARLLKGAKLSLISHTIWENLELTWQGHDFVDSVRDQEIWDQTKKGVGEVGSFTFDIIKNLAKGFIKKKIEDHTGITLEI
jgi:hypothetical protein